MKRALLFCSIIFFLISCEREETPEPEQVDPTVTTLAATNIQLNTATSGFIVTNPDNVDITERGIVWSTDSLPTINLTTKLSTTIDTSTFGFNLAGLICGTKYYVRAYVITNSSEVIYGNQAVFNTLDGTSASIKKIILSKTNFVDTIIASDILVQSMASPYPGSKVYFKNEMVLPPGIYMYFKVDSSYLITRGYNGVYYRDMVAGDTMHINNFTTTNTITSATATINYMGPGWWTYSRAKVSVHIAGIANTTADSYSCLYRGFWEHMTITTSSMLFETNSSACSTPCVFQ